jgi:hypothetical protein
MGLDRVTKREAASIARGPGADEAPSLRGLLRRLMTVL